jgi:hypothetical protein
MLFKDFMTANKATLKNEMIWDNYGLNDVLLTAQDSLKERALLLLTQNYGKYDVGDILDDLCSDIYVNFPLLMQSLSIASSMTFQSVARMDIEIESRTVTEKGTGKNESLQSSNNQRESNAKNVISEDNSLIGETTNKGTVGVVESSQRNETNSLDGNNITTTPSTGSKSVALSHSMPEQAINNISQGFNVDAQGTPNLNASTVQNASENFSTINQFETNALINQQQTTKNDITNNNTRTDDTKQVIDNTTQSHSTNDTTGQEISSGASSIAEKSETEHTTTDVVNRELANKQYPFEISKFLESIDTVKPFEKWINAFSWLIGVV